MQTLKIKIALDGTITVPASVLKQLRDEATVAAANPEFANAAEKYQAELHTQYPNDDDFVSALLKNALRNLMRTGFAADVAGMGCGLKLAPPTVDVSIPPRIVTQIAAGKEQLDQTTGHAEVVEGTQACADAIAHRSIEAATDYV